MTRAVIAVARRLSVVAIVTATLLAAPVSAGALPSSLEVVPTPFSGQVTLTSTSARSKTDLWAVGYGRPSLAYPTRALALHWNGTSWTNYVMPHPFTASDLLYAVSMVPGTSEAWAVGYSYDDPPPDTHQAHLEPFVVHWDGTSWHAVTTPPLPGTGTLQGVSAISRTDVWAVGGYTTASGMTQTVTEHWDGTAWSIVASPNPSSTFSVLRSVRGLTAANAWAVGSATIITKKTSTIVPLVEHWHAGAWHAVKTPALDSDVGEFLSVGSKGASHIWAVGDLLDSSTHAKRTLIEEFVNGKWIVVASPNTGTSDNQLWSVAAASDGTIWAVGQAWMSQSGPLNTLVMRWDGTSWTVVPSPSPGTTNQLMGATTVGSTLWTVGGTSDGTTSKALVERSTP